MNDSSNRIRPLHDVQESTSTGFGFALVILFLLFEYVRPQDQISLVGALHLNGILLLLMVIAWFGRAKFRMVASPQIYFMILMLFLLGFHVPFAVNNFYAYTVTEGFFLLIPF